MSQKKLNFFIQNQQKWGLPYRIKYLKRLIIDYPYDLYPYLYLFPLLYKKRLFRSLLRILNDASLFIPHSHKIKEWMFFFLSYHKYLSTAAADYLLNHIIPLIKEKKASPFLLYCVSVYFFNRHILDSALFYIQHAFSFLKGGSPPYLINTYFLVASKLMDKDLIHSIIFSKSFLSQNDKIAILEYSYLNFFKTIFLTNNPKENHLQIFMFQSQYRKKELLIFKKNTHKSKIFITIVIVVIIAILFIRAWL